MARFQGVATLVGVYGSSSSMPGAMSGRINGRVVIGRWTDAASSVGASGWSSRRTGGASSAPLGRTVDSNTSGGPWIGSR